MDYKYKCKDAACIYLYLHMKTCTSLNNQGKYTKTRLSPDSQDFIGFFQNCYINFQFRDKILNQLFAKSLGAKKVVINKMSCRCWGVSTVKNRDNSIVKSNRREVKFEYADETRSSHAGSLLYSAPTLHVISFSRLWRIKNSVLFFVLCTIFHLVSLTLQLNIIGWFP